MNNIDDLVVQATHVKNGLEGVVNALYNMTSDDVQKMNIAIATLESIRYLAEKHANDLEEFSK
ncbi:hypothetical protein [Enterococcus bulliens]